MKVFVTDRKNKGLEVVAGKYQFVDGVYVPNDGDFDKLEALLVPYYGVTVEEISGNIQKPEDVVDPSILASQTRAAEVSGAGFVADAAMAAGEAAGDPNVTGTVSGTKLINSGESEEEQAKKADKATADPKVVDDDKKKAEAAPAAKK